MRARQLECFIAVMRAGTITAAARTLNISQPALSQVLLHTEDELGFALFERTRGRLRPRRKRSRCSRMRSASHPDSRASGGKPPIFALVGPALSGSPLLRRLPWPSCRRPSQHSARAIPMCFFAPTWRRSPASSGCCERAMRASGWPWTIGCRPISRQKCWGRSASWRFCRKANALARGGPIALGDLAGLDVISYRSDTRPAEELAHAARAQDVTLSSSLEIDVSLSAVGFVQAGLGVALVDALLPWQQFPGSWSGRSRRAPHPPVAPDSAKPGSLARRRDHAQRDPRSGRRMSRCTGAHCIS